MPLRGLLEKALGRVDEESSNGRTVIYECRHCGSKSEDPIDQCSVCCSTEIANYTVTAGSRG